MRALVVQQALEPPEEEISVDASSDHSVTTDSVISSVDYSSSTGCSTKTNAHRINKLEHIARLPIKHAEQHCRRAMHCEFDRELARIRAVTFVGFRNQFQKLAKQRSAATMASMQKCQEEVTNRRESLLFGVGANSMNRRQTLLGEPGGGTMNRRESFNAVPLLPPIRRDSLRAVPRQPLNRRESLAGL